MQLIYMLVKSRIVKQISINSPEQHIENSLKVWTAIFY